MTHNRTDSEAPVELRRDDRGLALFGDGMELRGDFSRMLPRLRQGRLQQELLVKAARIKGTETPTAVDCTAGLGEDSLLLAAAGFSVTLFERDETIAALLADALERAAADPALADIVARMCLVPGDSIAGLAELGFLPDVVYLDPMFPARTKSAAVKKKFQLLHHLEQPCEEEEALVAAALATHPRKVVIKRPAKGPQLAGLKPSYSIGGKSVRYDVLVPAR
jgi:16S rRNA (guanine1516-N2)-methyltransferase